MSPNFRRWISKWLSDWMEKSWGKRN
jgi:hypothetical protein